MKYKIDNLEIWGMRKIGEPNFLEALLGAIVFGACVYVFAVLLGLIS